MRSILCAATAAMLLVPAPAKACMSLHASHAVLFDTPPSSRPPGYSVFRVVGRVAGRDYDRVLVALLDPARARQLGSVAWLQAERWSSCTAWGRVGSEAYVVARLAGRSRGRALLTAKVYGRSWRDRVSSYFRWETFLASGPPL
jgi:hypothetical protein